MFETYYNNLITMKKAEIIREGMTWGRWANYESNFNSLMKWNKTILARNLADWLAWNDANGIENKRVG